MSTGSTSVSNWGSIPLKILWGIDRVDHRTVPLKDREAGDFISWLPAYTGWGLSPRVLNSWASFSAGWASSCSSKESPQEKVGEGETQKCLWQKAVYVGTVHWRSGDPSPGPRGYRTLTVSAAQNWRGAPHFTPLIRNVHILSVILQISTTDIFKYFTVYIPNYHHQQ